MITQHWREQLSSWWRFVRQLATDDAYERYLHHHRLAHTGEAPLDRRAFYVREQQRKWNDIKRCC